MLVSIDTHRCLHNTARLLSFDLLPVKLPLGFEVFVQLWLYLAGAMRHHLNFRIVGIACLAKRLAIFHASDTALVFIL